MTERTLALHSHYLARRSDRVRGPIRETDAASRRCQSGLIPASRCGGVRARQKQPRGASLQNRQLTARPTVRGLNVAAAGLNC
jgi:hypothetical protein